MCLCGTDLCTTLLTPHYIGLFPVVKQHSSTYVIDINGSYDTTALQRLKLAYVTSADSNPVSSPNVATNQHNRHVRWALIKQSVAPAPLLGGEPCSGKPQCQRQKRDVGQ